MINGNANGHALPAPALDLPPAMAERFEGMIAEIQNDYYSAKITRYLPAPTGVSVYGSGADYHYRLDTEFMRILERARNADRNNMVVSQGINRLVANLLQGGFTFDPQTGDPETDAFLKESWNDWACDPSACDLEGERTFHDFESAAFRHPVVDGDILFLPTNRGSLQALEAHRLRTPHGNHWGERAIVHGVELNNKSKRTAYWFTEEDLRPMVSMRIKHEARRVAARDRFGNRNVFHIYHPLRISQRRGVSALSAPTVPLNYSDDLQFAQMVKAKVASFYAIFREFELGSQPRPGGINRGEETTASQTDGRLETTQRGRPGMEITGQPGEKLQGFSPNVPNPEFFDHAHMLLTFVSVNLDMPLIVFLLDANQTNFSGWRGAIDQARIRWRMLQRGLVAKLHRPTAQWKIRQWIRQDRTLQRKFRTLGQDMFRFRFMPPRWAYIEPTKDAAANDLRASSNQASLSQIAAENGSDWDQLAPEIVKSRGTLIRAALTEASDINALPEADPENPVDWRELAYGHRSQIDIANSVVQNELAGPNETPASRGSNANNNPQN